MTRSAIELLFRVLGPLAMLPEAYPRKPGMSDPDWRDQLLVFARDHDGLGRGKAMTSRFGGDCVNLLDEAQGLTLEMAEAWLREHGWTQDGTGMKGWSKPKTWVYGDSVKSLLGEIPEIARIEGLSVQAVLREMNPRMRKGLPSEAARRAHRGLWLVRRELMLAPYICWIGPRGLIATNQGDCRSLDAITDSWSFWPCDVRGNKVRWPVDEKGEML